MSTLPFNWILFGMVLLALSLFVMGLFMVFRRYGSVEWTDWRTRRARSQGVFAILAAMLFGILGVAYFRPQAAIYADARDQISGYETRQGKLSSDLASLRKERDLLNGSFSTIENRLDRATAKLAYVTHERDTVIHERDMIDARIDGYVSSQGKWSQREQDMSAEIVTLLKQRDHWKSNNANTSVRMQDLEVRYSKRQDAIGKDYALHLAGLQKQIERQALAEEARKKGFNDRLGALMSQRDRLKAHNSDLAVQRQDIIDRHSLAMEARENDHSTRYDGVVAERNRLKLTIAELTSQRQDLIDRQSLAMQAREQDSGSRIDDIAYERDSYKSRAAAMTDQYISLEKHYAIESKGRQQRNDAALADLRSQLANQRAQLELANSSTARLNLTLNQQRSDRLARDEKWSAARSRFREDQARFREVQARFMEAQSNNGDLMQQLAGLRLKLANLRKDQQMAANAAPKPDASQINTRATLPLINHFNASTDLRLISSGYNITAMPGGDMVREQTGEYYRVALRNPKTGRAYQFASGSYTNVAPRASFVKSLDRVVAEIKKALDGRADYRFYVRGSASTGRYRGKLVKGHKYRSVKVKKHLGKNSYASTVSEVRYGNVIRNADLPNLRAAYLQNLIASRYKMAPPEILEGNVSRSKNTSEQSVSLILYVKREGDWMARHIQRAGR